MSTHAYRYWLLDHNTGELVAPIVGLAGALVRFPSVVTVPSEGTNGLYASTNGRTVLALMMGTPCDPAHLVYSSVLLDDAQPAPDIPGAVVTHRRMRLNSLTFCDATPAAVRARTLRRYRGVKVAPDWPADLWRKYDGIRSAAWAGSNLHALASLKLRRVG